MPLKAGWDIVFIVRPAAATADYVHLKRSVADLLSRASLLPTDEEHGSLAEVNAGSGGELAT